MNIYVYKTDLATPARVQQVGPALHAHPMVQNWSVDVEDCDHVLRVVADRPLQEKDIAGLVKGCGYCCEPLTH